MSFQIEWPTLDQITLEKIKTQITEVMNKGELPDAICDVMRVVDISLGDTAPTLQFLDIPEVSEDGFEGHFKVAYAGNGSITLQTKVQVNPFAAKTATSRRALRHLGSLIAHQPTVVPLSITISQVRIDGELVLTVKKKNKAGDGPIPPTSRTDGSLVLDSTSPSTEPVATAGSPTAAVPFVAAQFKADPLTSVTISSSFDDFGSVKDYLQEQVEGSLRKLFVEDFPQIVSGVNQQLGSSPEKDNAVIVLEPK
jgi:distribution and morphology protein 34